MAQLLTQGEKSDTVYTFKYRSALILRSSLLSSLTQPMGTECCRFLLTYESDGKRGIMESDIERGSKRQL